MLAMSLASATVRPMHRGGLKAISMKYQDPMFISFAEVEAALARNDPEELLSLPIAVSLYAEDLNRAQDLCAQLAVHSHPNVRGNAILGFGHLARRFRQLDRRVVDPLVASGLQDPDSFVRGQADCASSDIAHFLGPLPGTASI